MKDAIKMLKLVIVLDVFLGVSDLVNAVFHFMTGDIGLGVLFGLLGIALIGISIKSYLEIRNK